MSRYLWSLVFISGVCVIVHFADTVRDKPMDSKTRERPQVQRSVSRQLAQGRIWYQPQSYPKIAFPNGRSEIVRSVLRIARPMHFGSFVWNDDGIPDGPLWMRIDPGHQLMSVFKNGHEIGSAVILFGTDAKPTPVGVFTVLQKDEKHYSSSYGAPMPYMLRLTNDGVAIHGSSVRLGWATHGCIGVPIDFARRLFLAAKKGDPVFITSMPLARG